MNKRQRKKQWKKRVCFLPDKQQARIANLRRDVAPLMVDWWNDNADRLGFSLIPPDWVPWPEVNPMPGVEGEHDRNCFFNSHYLNTHTGLPVVVGVHFGLKHIRALLHEYDPVKPPLRHAVNLDWHGRIIDATWGHGVMTGLMVGRAFAVGFCRANQYCTDMGFPK